MAGQHKYAAVLAIAAAVILVTGGILKPKPPAHGKAVTPEMSITQAEMQRLQEIARRNSLRNLSAQFASVAASGASSLLYIPESQKTAVLLEDNLLLIPRAPARTPSAVNLATDDGQPLVVQPGIWPPGAPFALTPTSSALDAHIPATRPLNVLEQGQWLVLITKGPNGSFLFYPGVYSGTAQQSCGTIRGPQIQISIPVQATMAGGGVFNLDGNLIGVVAECGESAAVLPITGVRASLADSEQTTAGKLASAFGMRTSVPEPELQSFLKLRPGMMVTEVWNGWPAARAGLQPGDNIVAVGDSPVNKPEHLQALLSAAPDQGFQLKIQRGNRFLNLALIPADRLQASGAVRIQSQANGLLVEDVPSDSPTEDAGLRPGDRILSVNGTPAAAASARKKLASGNLGPAFLTIERDQRRLGIFVHE